METTDGISLTAKATYNSDISHIFNPDMDQYEDYFEIKVILKVNTENTEITKLMNQMFDYSGKSAVKLKKVHYRGNENAIQH